MTLLKMAAAVIISVLLLACGGGGDSTATPSPSAPVPSTPTPVPGPTPVGCANGAGTSDCIFRYTNLVIMVDVAPVKNLSALSDIGGKVSVGGTTSQCAVYFNDTNVLKAEDGRPIVQCQVSPTNRTRKNYVLHPGDLALSEYTGAIPSGATLTGSPFGSFGSSPYNSCAVGGPVGMSAISGGMLYYTTNTSDQLMRVNVTTAASTSCSGATPVPAALVQFVTAVSN